MEDLVRAALAEITASMAAKIVAIELSYPEQRFGDFSTNVAIKLALELNTKAHDLAQNIALALKDKLSNELSEVSIAGPGFINISLADSAVQKEILREATKPLAGQSAVVEFSDPNPFKVLHAGHLYTSIVGDAITNLLASAGATVHRVNYGGDVGLHVAKSIWAMLNFLEGEEPSKLSQIEPSKRSEWMSEMYVSGNSAYEDDEAAKNAIVELNKRVYAIQANNDHDSNLAQIYWTTRSWSYEEFNRFYSRLNIHFDKFYTESEVAQVGLGIVLEQLDNGVFKQSEGAVVFEGESYGLHTRVFINSHGLPTYEGKELGLAELKKRDFKMSRSIIITGNEQQQYMAVVLQALSQFAPELAEHTTHLTHGMVRLSGGKKMSSRQGNILRAGDVLDAAEVAAAKLSDNSDNRVVLAAVKYAFLKQRIGGDVIYEPEESVNILGNSGPYLQYACARASSVVAKAGQTKSSSEGDKLQPGERALAIKLSRFASTLDAATAELSPHLLCTYLYDLAQEFNRFYEANRVIGDEREAIRLYLTQVYAKRLKQGLGLLGIESPERL